MVANVKLVRFSQSTSTTKPRPQQGQITEQKQITVGKKFVIHRPGGSKEEVFAVSAPFRCGWSRCVTFEFISDDSRVDVNLADVAVVAYSSGEWNIDNWLGEY